MQKQIAHHRPPQRLRRMTRPPPHRAAPPPLLMQYVPHRLPPPRQRRPRPHALPARIRLHKPMHPMRIRRLPSRYRRPQHRRYHWHQARQIPPHPSPNQPRQLRHHPSLQQRINMTPIRRIPPNQQYPPHPRRTRPLRHSLVVFHLGSHRNVSHAATIPLLPVHRNPQNHVFVTIFLASMVRFLQPSNAVRVWVTTSMPRCPTAPILTIYSLPP